jgi:hypothetical protein
MLFEAYFFFLEAFFLPAFLAGFFAAFFAIVISPSLLGPHNAGEPHVQQLKSRIDCFFRC